jgi:hypothetical protein
LAAFASCAALRVLAILPVTCGPAASSAELTLLPPTAATPRNKAAITAKRLMRTLWLCKAPRRGLLFNETAARKQRFLEAAVR